MAQKQKAAADTAYMELAIRYARQGLGTTAPNPSVGALIVDEASGEIIARGRTQAGGRPHAETEAIRRAGPRARGATMYVTLEPCSHHGKTGPCAEAIINSGLRRVVVANTDPDQRVSGRGLAMLKGAGIAVTAGVKDAEARWLHAGHLLRVTERRPFVQLKLAVGSDGLIAAGDGKPVWVTGPEARAHGHLLRARTDAILIGRGTSTADDPALTCRLPGLEHRSPMRLILDARLAIDPGSQLVRTADAPRTVVLFDPEQVPPDALEVRVTSLKAAGAWLIDVPSRVGGWLDLTAVVRAIARLGITRLLIEGGPTVARSFLEHDLVDEVLAFVGTAPAGPGGLLPMRDRGLEVFDDAIHWTRWDERCVGQDRMTSWRRHHPRT